MGEWAEVTIGQLIENEILSIGDGYRAKNSELGDEGLPFARAANVSGGFQFNDTDHAPLSLAERIPDKCSHPGDVVFTSKGTVGRFAFVSDDTAEFVYSPQLCYWRVTDRSRIEPRFMFAWLQGRDAKHQFSVLKGQTDMADYISLRDQRTIVVPLPPLPEQRAIAGVLGAFDDKIESNRRVANGLDRVCRTAFALLASASRETVTLGTIATVTMGQSPPGDSYSDSPGSGPLMVQGNSGFGWRHPTLTTYTSSPTARIVSPGSTLMTVRAPVGAVNVADRPTAVGRGVAALNSDHPTFLEYLIRYMEPRWGHAESGTIFPSVNKSQIIEQPVPAVSDTDADEFERRARTKVSMIEAFLRESRTLTSIRDALLPKLVSGQIRVPLSDDVEEQVGHATEALTADA